MCAATNALADAQTNYSKNNGMLSGDYSHLGMSMSLDSCRNKYVSHVRAGKSIAFESTFNAGNHDAYMNRFMYAFFGTDGNLIDPFAQPLERRTVVDGGGDFQWTPKLKKSSYRVPAGTSMKVLDTGERHWMVRAQPLTTIPSYVPKDFYTIQKVSSGTPTGYSFAYHLLILHDDTNTENKPEDDDVVSDCVFYYATE